MRVEVPTVTSESPYRDVPTQRAAPSNAPRMVEAFGERRSLHEWCALVELSAPVLAARLTRFSPELALILPPYARVDPQAQPGEPAAWTWELLDWEDDIWARRFVAEHAGGASLDEVAAAIGIVRERVRQVEEAALRKVRARAEAMGLDFDLVLRTLAKMRDRSGFEPLDRFMERP